MSRELITSWADYQLAIDRLLAMAEHSIRIYDEDLLAMKLDTSARIDELKRLLHSGQHDALHIAVRNAEPLRHQHPRLANLFSTYTHQISAQQTPDQLAHLRDAMLLVDGRHALIRFDRDQARSKLLIDEADEIHPYANRFAEIWAEGGEPATGSTLGL